MKTLWFEQTGNIVPYDPAKHRISVQKFLFWQDGDGGLLVASQDRLHKRLWEHFKNRVPARTPDGAGDCDCGKVLSWSSFHFRLMTPETLRPQILVALNM